MTLFRERRVQERRAPACSHCHRSDLRLELRRIELVGDRYLDPACEGRLRAMGYGIRPA